MGRYHTLFYCVFAAGGLIYFSLLLFQGVIISIFPQSEFIMRSIAQVPGLILFGLAIILGSAIIVYGVRKIYRVIHSGF